MPAHRYAPSGALRHPPPRVGTLRCANARFGAKRRVPKRDLRASATRCWVLPRSPLPQDRAAALGQTAVRCAHRPEGTAVSTMPDSPDFRSPYRHGFLRVAACTLRTVIAEPAANAASVLATARECHDDGVGLAVFPELTLSGYSIEDILLQDTLLDASEAALAEVVAGVGRPAPGARRRPAVCGPAPGLQRRGRRAPRAGAGRGAEVVPADLPRVLRAAAAGAGRRRARHDPARRRRGAVRAGPAVRRRGRAGLRAARRGVRGHVGADPAERGGGARGGDRARQHLGQPDHRRAAPRPLPAARGRRRRGASRPTSTRRRARASRPPTSPGTARR